MLERLLKWVRREGLPTEAVRTHFVMFEVDGQLYTTNDLPEELAQSIAKNINGVVLPVDINKLNEGGSNEGGQG